MTEQVLVNISKAPCVLTLPTGRPVAVDPGFAIQGDHFAKFASSGTLVPLHSIPVGFTVRGIIAPLAGEGVRQDAQAPSYAKNANKSKQLQTMAAPKPISAAQDLADKTQATLADASKALLDGVPGNDPNAPNTCQGLTAEAWKERLRGISDATFLQQMKLNDLRKLAEFFGVESAGILQTKPDFVRAIRLKVR